MAFELSPCHAFVEERRLWANRDVVPPRLAMPDAPPWDDAPARDLLGARPTSGRTTAHAGSAMQRSSHCWHRRSSSSKRSGRTSSRTFDEYRSTTMGGRQYRRVGRRLQGGRMLDSRGLGLGRGPASPVLAILWWISAASSSTDHSPCPRIPISCALLPFPQRLGSFYEGIEEGILIPAGRPLAPPIQEFS
jgi:hypothetical protein